LRTFFLQCFIAEDDDFEEPEIWLGTFLEEFPTLDRLSRKPATKVAKLSD